MGRGVITAPQRGDYFTDEKKLIQVLSMDGNEFVVEDVHTLEVKLVSVVELARPDWRFVKHGTA